MEDNNQESSINQPPSQETQQPPVPPSNSPKPKLPLFILITFIFLVLIGGGVYLIKISNLKNQNSNPQLKSQNLTPVPPSPTIAVDKTANPNQIRANWKTYTNQREGYSLKIMSGWRIVEEDLQIGDKRNTISSVTIYFDSTRTDVSSASIITYKNPEKLSVVGFIDKYDLKLPNPGNITPTKRKSIMFSGPNGEYEALWFPVLNGGVFSRDSYIVKKEDKVYEIALFTPPGEEPAINIFDQILQTFRFTQ